MRLSRIPKRLSTVAYSALSPSRHAPQGEAPKPAPVRKPWHKEAGAPVRTLTGRPLRRKREEIALRDKYTCQCGCKAITPLDEGELDHVIPYTLGGKDYDDNLQWLRKECHAAKTATENNQQRRGW